MGVVAVERQPVGSEPIVGGEIDDPVEPVVAPFLVVSAIRRKELTFDLDVRLSILTAVFLILSLLFFRQLVSPELTAVDVLRGLILLLLWGYWSFVAGVKWRDARKEQQGGGRGPAGVDRVTS